MAKKISEPESGWRVRLESGVYEMDLSELLQWVASGRVQANTLVRPPVLRRWKRADNCPELSLILKIGSRGRETRREAGERPAQELRKWDRLRILRILVYSLLLGFPVIGLLTGVSEFLLGFPIGLLLFLLVVVVSAFKG